MHAVKNTTTRRIALGVGFFLLTLLLLSANYNPAEIDLHEGQISPVDISYPQERVLEDRARTEELQKQAEATVQKVYQENPQALADSYAAVQYFFQPIAEIRNQPDWDESTQLAKLQEYVQQMFYDQPVILETLNTNTQLALLHTDQETFNRLKTTANEIIGFFLTRPIKEEDLPAIKADAEMEVLRRLSNEHYQKWVQVAVQNSIHPSMVLNQEATEEKIGEARKSVTPVQKTIKPGQIIVRKGDPVSAEDLDTLRQLGLLRIKSTGITLSGFALLILVTMVVSVLYLRRYYPEIYQSQRLMLLLCVVVIAILMLARGISAIDFGNQPNASAAIGFLIPIAAGTMLISLLINSQVGVLSTLIIGILVSVIVGEDLSFLVVALISGLVGVYSVSKVDQGWDLARGGILVGGINVIAIVALSLIAYESTPQRIFWSAFYGLLNGVLSGVIAIGLLPTLEVLFNLTSSTRLLELSNPNHPLLKRLLLEAPGTYHHSIVVGNLGEAAAEAVGAQPLLVRVGAYYHDIGKLRRPYFFIENQFAGENPHDKISPSLSALIITSHTKDGVELARQHRLPEVIVEIINQHHGNSLVSYFYKRALENDPYDSVNESTYRYDAPKPKTKEAAVVMLSDSIEAAVHSLHRPTPGRIEGVVRRIIKERLNDGQLEECALTFKDLDLITNAFLRILNGMHHNRIEYPDVKELERRRSKGVNASNESGRSSEITPKSTTHLGEDR